MLDSIARGERRQITVMFCDLVDSTALSDRLDPADERETLRQYHAHAETVVASFEGIVAQYRGDGVQVYFGALQANEDDAERAILAALAIIEGMPQTNERLVQSIPSLAANPIRVRIGVHTGPVVVDAAHVGDRQDRLAWGVTINVTSRIEAVTPADTCVISDATHKLVEGLFELESLGLKELKGVDQPIEVYRVLSPISPHHRRRDATTGHRLPTFLGRRAERARLLSLWAESIGGRGHAIRLTGEPGMGKSRLVESLKTELREPYAWVEIHCSAYHSLSPFFPVIEAIRHALKFRAGDSTEDQLSALDGAIANIAVAGDVRETRSLMAALLGYRCRKGRPAQPVTLSCCARRPCGFSATGFRHSHYSGQLFCWLRISNGSTRRRWNCSSDWLSASRRRVFWPSLPIAAAIRPARPAGWTCQNCTSQR